MEKTIIDDSGTINMTSENIQFTHFDVVSDTSDHHYKDSNKSGEVKSSVCKKIMREWQSLEKDLPESIYVRVYEDRIDLLRAVIIGASGTPYHDGLFFFDIYLPQDYPKEPPKVYYHSHGLRINPNLYANGYVCLSLINTWSGTPKERWKSSESTILQLLVSIQGLVLNEKPYFNEPGFEGDKSDMWIMYNKDTFTHSCTTMLNTLRNPPKNFEGFIREYFCARSNVILGAIKGYRDGEAIVGHYRSDGSSLYSSTNVAPPNFKANMDAVYLNLEKAFREIVVPIPKPVVNIQDQTAPAVDITDQTAPVQVTKEQTKVEKIIADQIKKAENKKVKRPKNGNAPGRVKPQHIVGKSKKGFLQKLMGIVKPICG